MTEYNFFCSVCGLNKHTLTVKNGNMICSQCEAKEFIIKKELESEK